MFCSRGEQRRREFTAIFSEAVRVLPFHFFAGDSCTPPSLEVIATTTVAVKMDAYACARDFAAAVPYLTNLVD